VQLLYFFLAFPFLACGLFLASWLSWLLASGSWLLASAFHFSTFHFLPARRTTSRASWLKLLGWGTCSTRSYLAQ
jgi:hypothetical protein